MRFFIAPIEDNFVIIPTVVLQLGRCECCNKVGGIILLFSWINIEVGLELPFWTHRP